MYGDIDSCPRRVLDQDFAREAFVETADRPAGGIAITFPDHRGVIAEDARRFRNLPPQERWRELFALRRWGSGLTVASSRGAAIRRLEADAESAWQAIQRELFARHGG